MVWWHHAQILWTCTSSINAYRYHHRIRRCLVRSFTCPVNLDAQPDGFPKTPFFCPQLSILDSKFGRWTSTKTSNICLNRYHIYIYKYSAVCSMSKYIALDICINVFFFDMFFFCENNLIISCHQLQRSSVVSKSTTPWAAKSEERCSLGTKPAKLENIVASKFTEDLFSVGQYLRSEIRRFLFLFQTSHPMLGSTYYIRFI